MERTIKRGDIFYADLNPIVGSEQGGRRPVLIVSNDIGNTHSPTVIIVPITSRVHKGKAAHTYRGRQPSRGLTRTPLSLQSKSAP